MKSKLIKLGDKHYPVSLIMSISEVKVLGSYRTISLINDDDISDADKEYIQEKIDSREINLDDISDYIGYEVEFITDKPNIIIGMIKINPIEYEKLYKENQEKILEWESKI